MFNLSKRKRGSRKPVASHIRDYAYDEEGCASNKHVTANDEQVWLGVGDESMDGENIGDETGVEI